MAREHASDRDPTFTGLPARSESLPVESRTRRDDYDDGWHLPFEKDSWVDEAGVVWSAPKNAGYQTLKKLMARPEVRVIHASPPDQTVDVDPRDRDALLQAIRNNWKGREEYYNGWQNYSARVFKDDLGRPLVVVQQWCSG